MLPGQFKPFGITCCRVVAASRRSLANPGFLTQTNTQMQELLRKMEADALARLPLPVGRSATQELARYKGFLKLETNRLKMLHRAGAGGLEVCNARAAVLDLLLKYLWEAAWAELPLQAHQELPSLALVAIGGYGRSELNPYSDIDLMFLHHGQVSAGRPYPTLTKVLDGILYPLWDVGLKVGHSVRTTDEAIKVANSDMQSKTSLIESRLVMGSEALFSQFQKMLVARCVQGYESEYIGMRVADQKDRRLKFGNSACMQEPNIKSGCGGLRDFQNLVWMAFFKYRTRSLADLETHGLITGPELKQLRTAYDFLLRVRTEMHYHADRAMDVLSKNLQPAVAHNLGYRERSPSKRIEGFMREVYTHSRNIFLLTRTIEQRLALLPVPRSFAGLSLRAFFPGKRPANPDPVDGFKFINGEIHAVSNRVFRDQPRRLMRVFLHAQQRGLKLHPDLAQLIRRQLSLVDRSFLADEHVRETFLSILNQRGAVSPILRAMHEVDLLGKYIPEFGRLTCLVQHEFYHQYTADEHTLVCIEQLDRIWEAKEPPHKAYTQLLQDLERPSVLYLALLLHDVGKPNPRRDHCKTSSELALRVARRLALDAAATHSLRLIIENHLLMSEISQRRDLDDPAVIRHFAKTIQTAENLSLLTLHTFVDAQATSDKLWNGFKDSLLWTLHLKTARLISGGDEFLRVEEKQRELLMQQVERARPDGIALDELEAHFKSLPPRYFQIHSAAEVVNDLTLTNRFMRLQIADGDRALSPALSWQNAPDRGYTAVKICTWDRAGLFQKIAGSLSASGLTILGAQVFTRKDGIVLDTFFVADALTGSLPSPAQRERFEAVLTRALNGEEIDFHALIARQKISRPAYQAYAGEHIATSIRFDNDMSDARTLLETEAEDRIGLLYTISQALTEVNLDIAGAKICTEKGAAIDCFFVREIDGQKVTRPERQRAIEHELRKALRRLEVRA